MDTLFRIQVGADRTTWPQLVRRPAQDYGDIEATVDAILERVRAEGDSALLDLTRTLDGAVLESVVLEVGDGVVRAGEDAVGELLSPTIVEAIDVAIGTITRFHRAQRRDTISVETMPGVECWQSPVAYQRVGLYVPGGTAPLFSSFLMLAIPAKLAGCEEIVVCTPPGRDGKVHPALLYVAQRLGIARLHLVGGAQAIAAMAFGTESIPQVDKIFGPGNRYVTLAKQRVQQLGTAIDMPAGPSELLVIADSDCQPSFVAADLLSQAEHGPDSMVVLLSDSHEVCRAVRAEVLRQVERLPRRETALAALASSFALVLDSLDTCMAFSNLYAPEHLILAVSDPEALAGKVRNAGSVFLGHLSGESIGDYASGTNHTLPTSGHARGYSGVSLASFQKLVTFQRLSEDGLRRIGPAVETMAEAEGLQAHRDAVSVRLDAIGRELSASSRPDSGIRGLLRPHLRGFGGYVSARHTFTGQAKVFLDANELPYETSSSGSSPAHSGSSPAHSGSSSAPRLNRYPDPHQSELRGAIARLRGLDPSRLFLGNGSDEPIDLLLRAFCEPGRDKILICSPTYGMYAVSARIAGVEVVDVPLLRPSFHLDVKGVQRALSADPSIKILFLCSPNNPTGNLLPVNEIEDVIRGFDGLAVVDEAYIDFARDPGAGAVNVTGAGASAGAGAGSGNGAESVAASSWTASLDRYPNLVVLQTLSKAFGLAGIRLGMAWGDRDLVRILDTIKPPYNVNELTLRRALHEVTDQDAALKRHDRIREILSERNAMEAALKTLPIVNHIHPSDANFLLVHFKLTDRVMSHLREEGIIVRDRSGDVAGTIRITIGTPEENTLLLDSLKRFSRDTLDLFSTLT